MEKFSLLVCDEDSAYVHALSEYLYSRKKPFSVSVYTQIESFLNGSGHFDLALLGKTFLECFESQHPDYEMNQVLFLSETADETCFSYDCFYKFQNMSNLNDIISKLRYEKSDDEKCIGYPQIIGIFSPVCHDLRLPFALTLSQILAENQKVLFMDLESFSSMSRTVGTAGSEETFTDVIYLMESQGEEFCLEEHIFFFEDMALLPEVKSPTDLWSVSREDWKRLGNWIHDKGYCMVCLFDHFLPEEQELLCEMDEVVLLGKNGDSYGWLTTECEDFFQRMNKNIKIRKVDLNMSSSNVGLGICRLKSLVEGNLGSFVRDEFKGTIAFSNHK